MAATCLSITPSSSSSSSFIATSQNHLRASKRLVSWPSSQCSSFQPIRLRRCENRPSTPAVLDGEAAVAAGEEEEEDLDDYDYGYDFYDHRNGVASERGSKSRRRPCELYVCNLPRSCDVPELAQMFKPFGTVFSVEISRNPETGKSRGSAYVTVDSIEAAKAAITALDGSDVGGREMRVKFSIQMNPRRRSNSEAMTSTPVRNLIYESPYKLYVGNLAWAVQPEELRNQFSQFGHVTSARVVHDRKAGKPRTFGFLSFASAAERDAAKSLNGKEFCGRIMVVRDGTEKE